MQKSWRHPPPSTTFREPLPVLCLQVASSAFFPVPFVAYPFIFVPRLLPRRKGLPRTRRRRCHDLPTDWTDDLHLHTADPTLERQFQRKRGSSTPNTGPRKSGCSCFRGLSCTLLHSYPSIRLLMPDFLGNLGFSWFQRTTSTNAAFHIALH